MAKRRRSNSGGFYDRRTPRAKPEVYEEEIRRRLREAVYTTPEERRLLIEAARVLRPEKGSKAGERAAAMKAAMDLLGDQLLPPE